MQPIRLCLLTMIVVPMIFGQGLTKADYKAGKIILWEHISKILLSLPSPKSVTVEDATQSGGKYNVDGRDTLILPEKNSRYEFDSLSIRTNGFGLIECIMFTSVAYKTPRGVSVGDSIQKVIRLYGKPTEDDYCSGGCGQNDDVLAYCRGSSTEGITFSHRNGRVICITIGRCVQL